MAGSTVRAAALAPAALVAVLVVPGMLGAAPAAHARSDFPRAMPAAAPCAKQTKKLQAFKRAMPKGKKRFFRTHTSAAQRRKFVQKQKRKLAQLKRARARCLARAKPKPDPVPRPAEVVRPGRAVVLRPAADHRRLRRCCPRSTT